MYVQYPKGSQPKIDQHETYWGKPYLGKLRPSEITKRPDGITNCSLTCCYCKDTGHEPDKCKKAAAKIQRGQLAVENIIVQNVLNEKHP